MRDPFARATQSILGRIGKDALLRGAPAGRVNIEHGVEVFERHADGEAYFTRSIATIDATYQPKQGDALVLFTDNTLTTQIAAYTLGRLYQDNGYLRRYVVLDA